LKNDVIREGGEGGEKEEEKDWVHQILLKPRLKSILICSFTYRVAYHT
jgi:hypothetical protein